MSSINLYSSQLRLTGIASGLDTDQIISDLMRLERAPLDRLYQKKQLAEWKRDEYRDIINLIRGLKDEYFNVLKPSNYLLSNSTYKKFSAVSSDSSAVTASASTEAMAGTYEIVVKELATASEARSTSEVSGEIQGTLSLKNADFSKMNGKNIVVTLDGVSKTITIGSLEDGQQINDLDDLIDDLRTKLDKAFGKDKIVVGLTGKDSDVLTFNTSGGATKITLNSASSDDGLSLLGISYGSSNRLNVNETIESFITRSLKKEGKTLDQVFDADGNLKFSINSEEFTFSKNTSISKMLSTINNNENAKVRMIYDELTDKFIITSKQLGAANNLSFDDSGNNFFKDILKIDSNSIIAGKDAKVEIGMAGDENKTTITRSSNSFTVNGITYNLQQADATKVHTIKVGADVEGIFESIKGFVEKYNEMIDTLNGKISEEYYRNYPPLTDEQKKAMNEKDIELWEEKAKTGLLRNDKIIENMVLNMRRALFDSIEGVDISITNIGITTGSYEQKGKLVLNEEKLKEAISNNPDKIVDLFNKRSEEYPSYKRTMTAEERQIRYKESGLAQRLYDIIEDNISTFRDDDGRKGFLLERAGMQGDASEFNNSIYKEIKDYETSISSLLERLIEKENSYYRKFAAMEEALNRMNAQSNWLYMQLSGLGNG